ncbi:MAG: IS1 family transposase [Defluviitaleaceae bacterium]|nr:IS1 family transposase [Defluviitaleaceae bacterium]
MHSINHNNGNIITFVLGDISHEMLWKLLDLLYTLNLNINTVYSDNNFVYHNIIPANILTTGKKNTQKIERKHLIFRTRLKRLALKTICYSKSFEMHSIVVSLLINPLEFVYMLFFT